MPRLQFSIIRKIDLDFLAIGASGAIELLLIAIISYNKIFASLLYQTNQVSMSEEVLIEFPTIVELIDFSLVMKANEYHVDRTKNTLTASLSNEDIDLAIRGFKGILLKNQN